MTSAPNSRSPSRVPSSSWSATALAAACVGLALAAAPGCARLRPVTADVQNASVFADCAEGPAPLALRASTSKWGHRLHLVVSAPRPMGFAYEIETTGAGRRAGMLGEPHAPGATGTCGEKHAAPPAATASVAPVRASATVETSPAGAAATVAVDASGASAEAKRALDAEIARAAARRRYAVTIDLPVSEVAPGSVVTVILRAPAASDLSGVAFEARLDALVPRMGDAAYESLLARDATRALAHAEKDHLADAARAEKDHLAAAERADKDRIAAIARAERDAERAEKARLAAIARAERDAERAEKDRLAAAKRAPRIAEREAARAEKARLAAIARAERAPLVAVRDAERAERGRLAAAKRAARDAERAAKRAEKARLAAAKRAEKCARKGRPADCDPIADTARSIDAGVRAAADVAADVAGAIGGAGLTIEATASGTGTAAVAPAAVAAPAAAAPPSAARAPAAKTKPAAHIKR